MGRILHRLRSGLDLNRGLVKPRLGDVKISDFYRDNLLCLWTFEKGPQSYDIISNKAFTHIDSGVRTQYADVGPGMYCPVTHRCARLGDDTFSLYNATEFCMVMLVRPDSIIGNKAVFNTSFGTTNGLTVWIDDSGLYTSNPNCLSASLGVSDARIETAPYSVSANTWLPIVLDFDLTGGEVTVCVGDHVTTTLADGSLPASIGTNNGIRLADDAGIDEYQGSYALFGFGRKSIGRDRAVKLARNMMRELFEPAFDAPFRYAAAGGGGDTNVIANTESLTLDTHNATIAFDVNVAANTEALTLSTHSATIAFDVNISANVEALTLTTQLAGIAFDINISANTEALTLTPYSASIVFDVDVLANAESLTLATYSASVSDGTEFDIPVAVEALTLTTNAATIGAFQAFTFPTVDNFSGLWVTDPLDKIKVLEIDDTEKTTFAYFDGNYTQHSQPIQLDRFGNIPSIYFEPGDCQVRLYNEYGVEKYAITRSGGAWYVGGVDSIEVYAETLTLATYPARINNAVHAITESLGITPYEARIDLATFTPFSASLTLTTNQASVSLAA